MSKLTLKNGLLYTSVTLSHDGRSIVIDDVIVDTGACHTIIITDSLLDIGASFGDGDKLVKTSGYGGEICSSVRKVIDKLEINGISMENFKVDFGEIDPYERVNGLIGLDFLMGTGMIIDLVNLEMYPKLKE